MNKKLIYISISLLTLMAISNIILIFMIVSYKNEIPSKIDATVNKSVKELNVYDRIDKLIELKVSSIQLVPGKDGVSIKGDKGDKGDTGIQGISIKGDTGLSAYEIAVKNGFEGSEEEWLQSLKGNDGNSAQPTLLQCNVEKNRWEYRYNEYQSWQVLNDKEVPCTIKE